MLITDWWGKITHINLNFLTSITKETGMKGNQAAAWSQSRCSLRWRASPWGFAHRWEHGSWWHSVTWLAPSAEKTLKTCLSTISLTWGFIAKSPRTYPCLKSFQLSQFWSLKQHQTGHLLCRGEKQQKCLEAQAQALLRFWRSRWCHHHISKH